MNGLREIKCFADLLHKYRNKAHLSQQQLADDIGVSRLTELRWENGKTMPNITNIRVLAEFLAIPEDQLDPFLPDNRKTNQTVVPKNCGWQNLS